MCKYIKCLVYRVFGRLRVVYLDAVGTIAIRAPYQQERRMQHSNRHQIMAGDRMLQPHRSAFHSDRGIEQGTPRPP